MKEYKISIKKIDKAIAKLRKMQEKKGIKKPEWELYYTAIVALCELKIEKVKEEYSKEKVCPKCHNVAKYDTYSRQVRCSYCGWVNNNYIRETGTELHQSTYEDGKLMSKGVKYD